MNSESVDLIYLDPPFNSGQQWSAPVGSKAAGAAFKDAWTLDDVKEEWVEEIEEQNPALHHTIVAAGFTHGDSMQGYLTYMAIRLLEMRRLLKPTGSIYLHCDPIASHYLKSIMDAVLGHEQFRNEIIWRIGWVSGFKTQKLGWIRNHDTLLYYVASSLATSRFNKEYIPYPDGYVRRDGKPPTGKGIPIEDTWNCSAGDVLDSIMIKSFSTEKTGYPTQKPLALLERVVSASSNVGEVVLDPFCGCATTCVAAEKLGRQWIGIDLSEKAYDLVVQRLAKEVKVGSAEAPTLTGWNIVKRTDIPVRTDAAGRRRSKNIRELLYGRQGGYCNGCGVHFPPRNLTLDHVVPRAKGGADADENLQLLCGACNSMKGSVRTQDELRAELRKKGLLH